MVLIIETDSRYKQLFIELAKSLQARIQIEQEEEPADEYVTPTDDEILDKIERGYREAQLHLEGKIKLKSLDEFLNELQNSSDRRVHKRRKPLLKKYRSLVSELAELGFRLKSDPKQGTPLGRDCYKIRLAIKSKGRGKSGGGARVITYVRVVEETVFLLAMYDKAERESISDALINSRLDSLDWPSQ